jgi:glycosyltransferase involved in cell wall biosynthesis
MRRRYAVEVVGDPREVLSTGVLGRGGRLLASGVAAYMRWAVRRADAVLYVTAERLQRRYPSRRGAAEAGMADVVLCADAFVAAPRRWAPGRARIIAVGSQEQLYKGHDVLLRAVRRLLDAGVDVEAVIVGGGRMHVELQELAWSSGVANRVRFTGVIQDRARLVAELDRATVFAMPSRTEGLPRALVEAMARGLPAVGTDVGGIPELLDSRCIVRPDDDRALAGALAELLRHADLWEEQSRRNLDVASGFRVEALRLRFESRLENAPAAAGKRRSRSA